MTNYELRQLASRPLKIEYRETEPDWKLGLVSLLAFCAMLAWLDAMDNADYHRKAAEDASRNAQEARQELQGGAHIRWVGNGYKCTFGGIQREWHSQFATECARVGNMITAARASP
jgi:hypothetical protein